MDGEAITIALLSRKCALLEEELAADRNTIMILTDIADAKWRLASSSSPRTHSYAPSPKHHPPPLMETPRMGNMRVAAPSVKSQEDRTVEMNLRLNTDFQAGIQSQIFIKDLKQAVADVSRTGTSDLSTLSILRVSPPGSTAEYDGVLFNDRQYSELDVIGEKNPDRLRAENEDGAVGDVLTQELKAAQIEIQRLNKQIGELQVEIVQLQVALLQEKGERKNGEKDTARNIPAAASAPDTRGGPTQEELDDLKQALAEANKDNENLRKKLAEKEAVPPPPAAAADIRGRGVPTQKEVDDLKRALAEAQQFINDEMDKKDMMDNEDVKETLGEVPLTKELVEKDASKMKALPPIPTPPPIPPPLTQNDLDDLR